MLQISQKRLKDAAETTEQIRKEVKTDRPELLSAQCYRARETSLAPSSSSGKP